MLINEDFYSMNKTTETNGIQRTTDNMRLLLNNGDLPLNEKWDMSICPWRVGEGSDLFKKDFPILWNDAPNTGGEWQTGEHPIYNIDKNGVPIYFMLSENYGAGIASLWYAGRMKENTEIPDSSYANYRTNSFIITNFDYSKLFYRIKIIILDNGYLYKKTISEIENDYTDGNGNIRYDIEDTKPIVGITFEPYYYNGNSFEFLERLSIATFADTNTYGGSGGAYGSEWIDYAIPWGTSGNSAIGMNFGSYQYEPIMTQWTQGEYAAYENIAPENSPSPVMDYFNRPMYFQRGEHWKMQILAYYPFDGYATYARVQWRLDLSTFNAWSDLKNYFLTQCAFLGCYFIEGNTNPTYPLRDNPDVYLGEIKVNELAITTGNYKKGTDHEELTNAEWSNNPWQYTPDPALPVDPTPWDSSQTSELESIAYDPAYGSEEYIVSSWALYEICRVLNYIKVLENEDFPLTGEIYRGICERLFGSTDPLEAILSVVVYPLDIRTDFLADTTEQILDTTQIGNEFRIAYAEIPVVYDTSAAAAGSIRLSNAAEISRVNWLLSGAIYGEAEIPYYANYKSFLDYEPYSSAELYVPYCGSVKLDPEIYIGHTIKVKYALSPTDGTVKAYIMRDNLVIDTLTGNMGAAVTLYTSDEVSRANNVKLMEATLQSQKQNKLKQAASFFTGAAGTLAGTATGGAAAAGIVSGLVSTVFNTSQTQLAADQTQIRIDTAETPFKQLQSGGGYLALIDELAIRLVVYRPEPLPGYSYDNWRDYGHTTGFACLLNGRLDEFAGYTECSNAIVDGISCTATEKNQIIKLLQSGVYL